MSIHNHSEIQALAGRLSKLLNERTAIILIGSVARNCAMSRSDVDILVVGETKPTFSLRMPDYEFHPFDEKTFLTQLRTGDDFPNWCTRFGVPLGGKQYWDEVLDRGAGANWPGWKRKMTIASRRLLACKLSILTDDKEAATESALFACDNLIRGLLLREGAFPLSRPELVKQVQPYAPHLGKWLYGLLRDPARNVNLDQILSHLLRTLEDVDPDLQRDYELRLEKISSEMRTEANLERSTPKVLTGS